MDVSDQFDEARAHATASPTWLLRRWERRATQRAANGRPGRHELARLLAVRSVLVERGRR